MTEDHPTPEIADAGGHGRLVPLTHHLRSVGAFLRSVDATWFLDTINALEDPAFDELRGKIRRRFRNAGKKLSDIARSLVSRRDSGQGQPGNH